MAFSLSKSNQWSTTTLSPASPNYNVTILNPRTKSIFTGELKMAHQKRITLKDIKKIPNALLGGSRYFDKKFPGKMHLTSKTDHDYYVQYTPELMQFLTEEKRLDWVPFTCTGNPTPLEMTFQTVQQLTVTTTVDANGVATPHYPPLPPAPVSAKKEESKYPFDEDVVAIFVGDNNCQLIVRNDAIMYNEILDSIDIDFYINFLWKSGPNKETITKDKIRQVFNQMFRSYYTGKGMNPAEVLEKRNNLEDVLYY